MAADPGFPRDSCGYHTPALGVSAQRALACILTAGVLAAFWVNYRVYRPILVPSQSESSILLTMPVRVAAAAAPLVRIVCFVAS